MRKFLTEF